MTNKVAITLIAAAAILTSCAGPSSTEHAATRPSTGGTTATTTPAPADPGGRWLGGDADRAWGDSGEGGSGDRAMAAGEAYGMAASTTAPASAKAAKPMAGAAPGTPD